MPKWYPSRSVDKMLIAFENRTINQHISKPHERKTDHLMKIAGYEFLGNKLLRRLDLIITPLSGCIKIRKEFESLFEFAFLSEFLSIQKRAVRFWKTSCQDVSAGIFWYQHHVRLRNQDKVAARTLSLSKQTGMNQLIICLSTKYAIERRSMEKAYCLNSPRKE